MDMISVFLYKQLKCAADKAIDADRTASTGCNYQLQNNTINDVIYYFLVQTLKTDPSREIYTYTT